MRRVLTWRDGNRERRNVCRSVRCAALLLAAAMVTTTCTSSQDASPEPEPTVRVPKVGPGLRVSGKPKLVLVAASKPFEATVEGVSIKGSAGSFGSKGQLTVAPVSVTDVPAMVGSVATAGVASGIVVDLHGSELAKPLTVRFRLPTGAAEKTGVAHVDDDGTWTPVQSSVDGGDVVVATDDFSSLVIFGIDLGASLNWVGSFVAKSFAGRSDPSVCEGGPSWASVTAAPTSVHSCVRSNTDGKSGTVRAELEIKSNRGTYQWVRLPTDATPDYTWVEGQPEWLRKAIGFVTKTDWTRNVLLDPGGRLTVGYRQPAKGVQIVARVYPDLSTVAMSVGVEVGKLFGLDEKLGPLTALYCLDVLDVDLAEPVTTWTKLPTSIAPMMDCFIDQVSEYWRNPKKAVTAAINRVAPDAPPAELEASASKFFKLGKAAVVVQLAGIAARVLTQTLDSALEALGFDNVGDVTLTLEAVRPVAPKGFGPGCDAIDVESSLCRFLTALGRQDPSVLTARERGAYDDAVARDLGGTSWLSDGDCEEVGDVSVSCPVRLGAPGGDVMSFYTILLSFTDGTLPETFEVAEVVLGPVG